MSVDFKMPRVKIALVGSGTSGEAQALEHPPPGQQPPGGAQAQGILGRQ